MSKKTFLAVVADDKGEVFEHPELLLAGMSGDVDYAMLVKKLRTQYHTTDILSFFHWL